MPVVELKKITIISIQSLKSEIIKELEGAGAVQITDFNPESGGVPEYSPLWQKGEALSSELDTIVHQTQYCLDFIKDFLPPKKNRLLSPPPKNPVEQSKFFQIGSSLPYKTIFDKCQQLDQRLIELKNRENRTNHLRELLNPWISLDFNLGDIQELSGIEVFLILLNGNVTWTSFKARVEEAVGECSHLQLFEAQKRRKGALIVISKEKSVPLRQILKEYDIDIFEPLPEFKGSPRDISIKLEQDQAKIEDERKQIGEETKDLLEIHAELMIANDYAQLLKARKEIEGYLGYTEQTVFVQGWITLNRGVELKDTLSQRFREIEILLKDPLPGEVPPILLSNPYPVKPFEQITKLYSLPNTLEFDPTPFVFPFFLIFFGICLSEAGYGIILCLVYYLFLRKLKLGDNPEKFFELLFLGGLSSLVFGALTGSWFGNLIDLLPGVNTSLKELKDSLMIVNPIINPIPFLIFCLVLGIIQIYTGLFLKMAMLIKARMGRDALLDEGVQILLLTAFISWILGAADIFPSEWNTIINWTFMFSLLIVIIVNCLGQQAIVSKLGAAILGIYALTGYLGDILSYSRLFALGLATGVIAIIVNTLIMAIKDIPGIGIILIPLIFCVGHLFNLILSTLGAFIHSLRLQYVEYFTKFYRGGGKPFEPYGIKTKYVEIIPPQVKPGSRLNLGKAPS